MWISKIFVWCGGRKSFHAFLVLALATTALFFDKITGTDYVSIVIGTFAIYATSNTAKDFSPNREPEVKDE